MKAGLAKSHAGRAVNVDARDAGSTERKGNQRIAKRVALALQGSKIDRRTRDALYALAQDLRLSYRAAALAHGINVAAVYRASRLVPEIREKRRHRQWGSG